MSECIPIPKLYPEGSERYSKPPKDYKAKKRHTPKNKYQPKRKKKYIGTAYDDKKKKRLKEMFSYTQI